MKVYKYTLQVTDIQVLELPTAAKILDIQVQNGEPQLWALVDERHHYTEARTIAIYGTGHPMSENCGEYIATFQMHNGQAVVHAFEVME